MAKFTILYERSVRVRQYETLKIGMWREFDNAEHSPLNAFFMTKSKVEDWIKTELEVLRAREDMKLNGP